MKKLNNKTIIYIIIFIVFISVSFVNAQESDIKEDRVSYIRNVTSLITNVDITVRNIGMEYLSMQQGVKEMGTYITQLEIMEYPEDLERKHKMIILSFKKIKMGLLLFSPENKEISLRLIRSGTSILKYVAGDIVKMIEEEKLK